MGAVAVASATEWSAMAKTSGLFESLYQMLFEVQGMKLREQVSTSLCNLMQDPATSRLAIRELGALPKLQRLLREQLGSVVLDRALAAAVMRMCHGGAAEVADMDEKQLSGIVWLLRHQDTQVLCYACVTLWLLARDHSHRKALGKLWAVDGLLSLITANTGLPLKVEALAALWILSCDKENAIRVAMKGGLTTLVGMLLFPNERAYIKLKTLATGVLFKLSENEDILTLMLQLDLMTALVGVVTAPECSVYLNTLAGGLIFSISQRCKGELAHIRELRGELVLEDLCTRYVKSESEGLRAVGALCAASLAMKSRSRKALHSLGCIQGLCRTLKRPEPSPQLLLRSLHALLNLSTEEACQRTICKHALLPLVALADPANASSIDDTASRLRDFAASILGNL
ncbi:unnamed protein product, partial [Chrysoparadoxa australica]